MTFIHSSTRSKQQPSVGLRVFQSFFRNYQAHDVSLHDVFSQKIGRLKLYYRSLAFVSLMLAFVSRSYGDSVIIIIHYFLFLLI
jgi:hypothetical protein